MSDDADELFDSGGGKVNPRHGGGGGEDGGEPALARLARRQDGVVSRDQLLALGFAYTQIGWRVTHGRLHRIHHNVYAVGHTALSHRAHLIAALLSAGPRAFFSHRSAAAVWGLRAVNVHRIELTVPGGTSRKRGTLVIHRTVHEPDAAEVRARGRLRVSSVERMLVELAAGETSAELDRLITLAVRKRILRLDTVDGFERLEATLAAHSGHAGMAKLAAALRAYRPAKSHASDLELAFDRLLAQHPEIPDPVRNVDIDRWEIDRYWPDHRLAVELDGRPYHVAARDMERDRIKDAALQRLGVRPIRFTDTRVEYDPRGILRDLYAFLDIEPAV